MRPRLVVIVVCLSAVLAACGSKAAEPQASDPTPVKKQVVVTTPVLGDFVSVLGGDEFDVKVLVPQNSDPTRYSLSPNDVTTVANADLLIENGNGLEPWFDSYIKNAEHRGSVVVAGNGVGTRQDAGGKVDPYTWVSPSNGRVMVANVRAALEQLDPDIASTLQSSERAYDSQIDGAIRYADNVLAPLSDEQVTYVGEPLGYYCDDFKLKCTSVAPAAFTTSSPVDSQVTDLVNLVKSNNSKAVVLSSAVNQSVILAIRNSTSANQISGSNALSLNTFAGANTKSYIDYQHNIADKLSAALR